MTDAFIMFFNSLKSGYFLARNLNSSLVFKFGYKTVTTKMKIVPIEALKDNYMYLVIDEASNECAAIDPVEPNKVNNLIL